MANTKISALTSASTPLAGTEVLPIVQSSATVKVAVDDLTVKNIRSNATTGILQVTGPAAASTRVMTTPNANFTVARTDAAQSFTGDQTLSTGNIIQGTANKGFNFTANTPGTGMTSQLLNDYEEITAASAACTGAITTSVSWKATKVGNVVTLSLPNTLGTASTATNFVYGTVLPTKYRPSASIRALCITIDAGALLSTPGFVFIDATSGSITVYKDMLSTSNFTVGTTAGLLAQQSFSWVI